MNKRFTSQELYQLRSDLPITQVITALGVSVQFSAARLRFCCPVCKKYHTATHPITNLARCFDCKRNYNTIELVMTVRQIRFVASVEFLRKIAKDLPTRCSISPEADAPRQSGTPSGNKQVNQPQTIGAILRQIFINSERGAV